jgi:hypothetical protein
MNQLQWFICPLDCMQWERCPLVFPSKTLLTHLVDLRQSGHAMHQRFSAHLAQSTEVDVHEACVRAPNVFTDAGCQADWASNCDVKHV